METFIVIIISLLLIIFNTWKMVKKYKVKCGNSLIFLFHKDNLLNLSVILFGVYLILMVLEQSFLLKISIIPLGVLFIALGICEIQDSV